MKEDPAPSPGVADTFSALSDAERARIRAEMRYAAFVVGESKEVPQKSPMERVLGLLSNGFVLLLAGSIISSILVPRFQQYYENRRQQSALMQECLTQFLLYGNSIWSEYYAILPLTQVVEIDRDEYLRYVKEITQVKLKRYDAYARVRALALVFRDAKAGPDQGAATVDATLEAYAIRINSASAAIDAWLRNLYCTPTKRERSPCDRFDPTFDAFADYKEIQRQVVEIGNRDSDEVAQLMVRKIRGD